MTHLYDLLRGTAPHAAQATRTLALVLAFFTATAFLRPQLPADVIGDALPVAAAAEVPPGDDLVNLGALAAEPDATPTNAQVERLAGYLARRYRVSEAGVGAMVQAAHRVGSEIGLDPLLILSVMAVESGFNPLAESVAGAQGLMQVMPQYHLAKAGRDADALALFDAGTNIRVGSQVLRETIRRGGSLNAGLQFYAGAPNDPDARYAGKVLSVRERLAGVVHG